MYRTTRKTLAGLVLALSVTIPTLVAAPPASAAPTNTNHTRITGTNWDRFKSGNAPYFSITVKAASSQGGKGIHGRAQLKLDGNSQRYLNLSQGSVTFHIDRSDLRNNEWVEVAVRTWPKRDSRPSQVVKFDVKDTKPTSTAVLRVAKAQIGDPYVYGRSGPNSFDCSGLVTYSYGRVGKNVPHSSDAIRATGRKVSNPRPGDVVWTSGHVSIYAGHGHVIEAARPGTRVRLIERWQRNPIYLRF